MASCWRSSSFCCAPRSWRGAVGYRIRHSGARGSASPESITTIGSMDSGPAPRGASRNDEEETDAHMSTGRTPMPAAYFVVRATVADPAKRKAFDEWYHREHLPDAAKAFGVKKAWRFWSVSDPAVHQATYEFADQPALDRVMNGDALKPLVAEFDRCWPEVKRTREIFVLAEEFGTG